MPTADQVFRVKALIVSVCVPLLVLTLTEPFQSFTVLVWLSVLLNVSMLWYAEVIIDSLKCFHVVGCCGCH